MPLPWAPEEEQLCSENDTDDDRRITPIGRSRSLPGRRVARSTHAATLLTTTHNSEVIYPPDYHLGQPSAAMGLRQVLSKPIKRLKHRLGEWVRRGNEGSERERNKFGKRTGAGGDKANLRGVLQYPEVVEGGPSRGEGDLEWSTDLVDPSTSGPPNSHNEKPNGTPMGLSRLLYR